MAVSAIKKVALFIDGAAMHNAAKALGYTLASYVSPRAVWWPQTTAIGENCFIQELNNIQPQVKLGDDVFLWAGNHIGHHSVIGDQLAWAGLLSWGVCSTILPSAKQF